MSSVPEIVATYEETIAQLRSQQQKHLPVLMLHGDDCQHMDISYIIVAVSDVMADLPEDLSVVAARIISDLALLNLLTSDKNALITEANEIIAEQMSDFRESLEKQLADVPETKLNRAVVIGTKHMNEAELAVLAKVYDKLEVTHVNHEERKDFVYYNYDQNPKLRENIVSAFYEVLVETQTESTLKFGNFVHTEAVMGFTSELLKVIKSKR